MAKTAAHQPKPYIFIFQLKGARAGKKKVPSAYTSTLSYVYREDQEKFLKRLQAIEEPEVSDSDTEVTFAAIDALIERCELMLELATDEEIEADAPSPTTRGFHPGVTLEQGREALEAGGFVTSLVLDPLAIPLAERSKEEAFAFSIEELARHVDLASLPRVVACCKSGGELAHHAACAEYILSQAFEKPDTRAFSEEVQRLAQSSAPAIRDALRLLAARASRAAKGKAKAALGAFVATLPAGDDPAAKKQLEAWDLAASAPFVGKGTGAKAAPKKPAEPVAPGKVAKVAKGGIPKAEGVEARIARIEAAAKKAGVRLPKGAAETAISAAEKKLGVKLPEEVRAFYLAHDGGPPNALACGGRELLSLAGMVRQWQAWKELFDDDAFEDDDVEPDDGVQAKWWMPKWIPVTYDFGGNHDMLDLAPAAGGKKGQIVSVWHDEETRTLEGDSFLDWLEEQTWSA